MKWDRDPYHDLKWGIFDLIRIKLKEEHAEKITAKQVIDAIEEMIAKLTSISND